jgi:hypothetical protein
MTPQMANMSESKKQDLTPNHDPQSIMIPNQDKSNPGEKSGRLSI